MYGHTRRGDCLGGAESPVYHVDVVDILVEKTAALFAGDYPVFKGWIFSCGLAHRRGKNIHGAPCRTVSFPPLP